MGEVLRFVPAVQFRSAPEPLPTPDLDPEDDFELLFIHSMVRRLRNSGFSHLSRQIIAVADRAEVDGDRRQLDALIDLGIGLVGTMQRKF